MSIGPARSPTTTVIDTDGTLAANSDALVASQKATKTYADAVTAAAALLAKLLTVDGTASGLDADLLRGVTPTSLAIALIQDALSADMRDTLEIQTYFQAIDAGLTALSGLTAAAGKIPYFTSGIASALATLDTDGTLAANSDTSIATQKATKTYVGTAQSTLQGNIDDEATARATADSGKQPLDAELTALAGLTSAADKLPYFTGAGTAGVADFTAAGRAIVDDADASAQRTTLGLGTVSTLASDTDGTLAGNSDVKVATQKATKTYVDGKATTLQGNIDDEAVARSSADAGKQPLDAELTALAGLTSAADKVPYFTGSGTAGVADFTAAGRAILDDADASAQRTTLGLAIGTNVQAYDAELAALAGLTSAADKVPYFTGSGTAGVADFSSAGRALVDDADASAQRTTLGLVIGTNVQAYDAELAAIAGLTSAADKVPYFTGSGTADVATFTATGRAVVGSASQQLACQNMGTWWIAGHSGVQVLCGAVLTEVVVASVLIPAGAMGANGHLQIFCLNVHNNNANTKRHRIYHNTSAAAGGTTVQDISVTTTAFTSGFDEIVNQNSASSQKVRVGASFIGSGATANGTGSINTANDSYIVFTSQKLTSTGNTAGIEHYLVQILYGA